MNLMNDCNEAQELEKDMARQRMSAGKLTTLRNVTIQAMSNLLSANIDSGLMHSIGWILLNFVLPLFGIIFFRLGVQQRFADKSCFHGGADQNSAARN